MPGIFSIQMHIWGHNKKDSDRSSAPATIKGGA